MYGNSNFITKPLSWCRVVHLDLKSSNVLIAADGSAKISDVGLAALMSQNYLSQMAPAGTWSWVAPEVILGGTDCSSLSRSHCLENILCHAPEYELVSEQVRLPWADRRCCWCWPYCDFYAVLQAR